MYYPSILLSTQYSAEFPTPPLLDVVEGDDADDGTVPPESPKND